MASHVEIFGTAFDVHGTWYARVQDGGGLLLPIAADKDLKTGLRDNQAYSFDGRVVSDHRGHPREFAASAARAIGTAGGAR